MSNPALIESPDRQHPGASKAPPSPPQPATSWRALCAARTRHASTWVEAASVAQLDRLRRQNLSGPAVLLVGEAGLGLEALARHLHNTGPHWQGPFHAVSCAAAPADEIGRELFGAPAGVGGSASAGWLAASDGGTLFLDDLERLPESDQVRLLHWVEHGRLWPQGSLPGRAIDVRLVLGSRREPAWWARQAEQRAELWLALSAHAETVAPLRQRPGDLLAMAGNIVRECSLALGAPQVVLAADATQQLLAHDWPGNVRELENTLHHALMLCEGDQLEARHLRLATPARPTAPAAVPASAQEAQQALEALLAQLCAVGAAALHAQVERALLVAALQHCGGHQIRTAERLGWSRNVLRARLIEHRLINARR